MNIDIDLRERLGDARDQRQRPTCLVFAVTGAHEANRGSGDNLSPEFLFYRGAQRSHRDPRRGLSSAVIAEALRDDGQPAEEAWPYLQETPDPATWRPPDEINTLLRATLQFADRTLGQVRDMLRRGTPVLLVIALTIAMYTPDDHGIVRTRANDVLTTRRHAVLAVGSGHAEDGDYLLVRNSWGQRWGRSGHGWLHDPYLSPHLQTTGVIAQQEH